MLQVLNFKYANNTFYSLFFINNSNKWFKDEKIIML